MKNNTFQDTKKEKMVKKYINCKANISYLQIVILIISIFAFCYLIFDTTESVLAQDGDYACCEEVISGEHAGESCQFVLEEDCDPDFDSAPTECDETSFCELGCCYSTNTGWCNENTPNRSCDGQWDNDKFCNIPKCQRGCCVLGRNAFLTTERNCKVKAENLQLEADFRPDVASGIECTYLTETADEGACVYGGGLGEEKTCRFTTKGSCENIGEHFYPNKFCSNRALETNCQAQDHKGCVEGEDSVYRFDSCGNREDIAEECSIFAGTICGQVAGEYKCKNIDCKVDGRTRKNGESWCEYDGTIGDSKDVVGSRHIKHICFMGEERIEPCEDYRNQICVGIETKLNDGSTWSEAACRINNWRFCVGYNTIEDLEEGKEKCEENPDCRIQHVGIDDFVFDMCVPNYPPGFDLITGRGAENAEAVCGMASQQCTVVYIKDWDGDCECEYNCDCEKAVFTQQMNDLCISLGDCGGYVNIEGEYTDDGYTSGAGRINGNQYKKYARPKPGQLVEPGDLSFLGGFLSSPSEAGYEPGDVGGMGLGLGMAGVGFATMVASWYAAYPMEGIASAVTNALASGGFYADPWMGGALELQLGAFGNALAGAGAMLALSSIAISVLGLQGLGAKIVTIAGYIAAGYTAYLAYTGAQSIRLAFGFIPYHPHILIIFIAIIIVVAILGIGEECDTKYIKFDCKPYQPPTGGKDCEKCNGDPFKPCSDYRCQSLGEGCELINKGTEHQMCINICPGDVSSPRISPLFGVITEGYQYNDTRSNNFLDGFEILDLNQDCIPEYTQVEYGIKTNKPAQCKIGTSAMQTYDEMQEFFGGSNFYLMNHTTILNIPSPAAFASQYSLTAAQIEQLGEVNFYVKCKEPCEGLANIAAYTIRTCVKPGPDLTAPYVTKTFPVNGAYIAYNQTEQDLNVWVNEPADCKWSTEKKPYKAMENEFSCRIGIGDYGLYGWPCNTVLTGLETNNKFYIKCKDQPQLPDENESRNTMRQSYIYELQESESELEIVKIYPDEDITAGIEPVTVTLETYTSGGALGGVSECSYKFREEDDYIRFRYTFSDIHKQVFSSITGRNYKIYIKCEDVAGNIAEDITEFSVEIDTSPPKITRVYYDGSLKIMTNEDALCAYSFTDTRCRFDIENATQAELMTGTGKEHSADWQTDSTYYTKCQDIYGREPGRCSIIVRPYDINF